MKTLIKIVVALALVTGAVQAARAAIKHYAFVDAIQESMLFAGSRTEEELVERIWALAEEHEIPLQENSVSVRREPFLVVVAGGYRDTVDLLPGALKRPWDFTIDVRVRLLEDTRPRTPSRR